MTKLQKELLDAVRNVGEFGSPIAYVEACEKVAKKYIEKAFTQNSDIQHYEAWEKENGVTGEVNS